MCLSEAHSTKAGTCLLITLGFFICLGLLAFAVHRFSETEWASDWVGFLIQK